jgi:hypothetical protein
MTARTLPGLGLTAFWDLGFDGWKDPMDANLRVLSALAGQSALSTVDADPGSPTDGDIHLLSALHPTNPGEVGVRDNAAWVYIAALPGCTMYDQAAGVHRSFDGTDWVDQVDKAYVDSAVALVSGGGESAPLSGIVSGCGVTYSGAALTFDLSAGSYYLDGDLLTAAAQSVTLTAADATNPRIDVLVLDATGTFGKVTGTAAASPSQPAVDSSTQLFLTFVLVPAAATDLTTGIINEDIYKEGAEWTPTATGSGITVNSTNNPFAGTKCIEGTAVTAGSSAKLVRSSAISFDGDGNLTFRIRSKATWNSKRGLTFQWYLAGVAKGSPVTLKSGTFGFVSSVTTDYQLVVVNKTLFAVPSGTSVDELRITDVGGSIGFYVDNIILQSTGDTTGGGTTVSGITQEQADARYVKKSGDTMSGDLTVPAEAYGAGWNGSNEVPTKNDVYDKIEGVIAGTASVDNDTTLASDSTTNPPSVHAVRGYVATAVTGLWDFKANQDCSANPNYPAASKSDAYVVSVAGKIGGASGLSVDVGDVFVASADNAGGTQASVGSSWFILEHNLVGALLAANNLSDLVSPATARANLGLGSIATEAEATAAQIQAGTASKAVAADKLVAAASPQTLTDGATVPWDMSLGFNAKVTIAGNRTLTVSNPVLGMTYCLGVIQDATGSRTMTWPASFDWGTTGAPTLTTTASKRDRITLFCTDAATPKFDAFLSGKGFS